MPLISFIVGAYGDFKPLRTCLSSLLDQTYSASEIEIIVTDNTHGLEEANRNKELCVSLDAGIIYEWTADRTNIEHLPFRHKRCLYTATEIGVGMATGEFIGFPNSDSYFCRNYVERMMRKREEASYEFLYCDIILGRFDRVYAPRSCTPASCNIDKSNFLMRREWFTGFDKKWENYELADGLMVDDLVRRGIKCGKVDECLCVHN